MDSIDELERITDAERRLGLLVRRLSELETQIAEQERGNDPREFVAALRSTRQGDLKRQWRKSRRVRRNVEPLISEYEAGRQACLRTARQLRRDGLSYGDLADLTGLTSSEVRSWLENS